MSWPCANDQGTRLVHETKLVSSGGSDDDHRGPSGPVSVASNCTVPVVDGVVQAPNAALVALMSGTNSFQGHFPDRGDAADGYAATSPVARFPANGYGLFDVAGNVWEWVADWYDPGYYRASPGRDPTGPEVGTRRVQRGGAFTSRDPAELRAAFRAAVDPSLQLDDVGFRCAADAEAIARSRR